MHRAALLPPREASRILGISYPTLKQWIYRGKIKTVKTPGGHHRIPESEIDRMIPKKLDRGDIATAPRQFPENQRSQPVAWPCDCRQVQRLAGAGDHGHRRAAHHRHHHGGCGERDAAETGRASGRADQVHGSDDFARVKMRLLVTFGEQKC